MWLCWGFQWRGTIKKAEHQRTDFLNRSVGENSQSPLDCKKIKPVNPKGNQSWIFIRRTDAEAPLATWCKEVTHWKRPWCWERLKAGEGDDRGWDGWMVSPTQWTWVWANSGSWWWTGKPDRLQSTRSQRVRHDWTTELNSGEGEWEWEAQRIITAVNLFCMIWQ